MNKGKNSGMRILFFIALAALIFQMFAAADPTGADVDVIDSQRRSPESAASLNAIAGNVSELNIVGNSLTQTWQGYYGNISGSLVLADGANRSMYAWNLTDPEGEIYASTTSVDFSIGNIGCYNFSESGGGYLDLSTLENSLGLEWDDTDGVNETFSDSLAHQSFYAGYDFIDGSSADTACPVVRLFNATGQSTEGLFEEVILYDNSNNNIVYTALIEENQIGFNNRPWDFQMLVGDDGHRGNSTTTSYYFYVEIE